MLGIKPKSSQAPQSNPSQPVHTSFLLSDDGALNGMGKLFVGNRAVGKAEWENDKTTWIAGRILE